MLNKIKARFGMLGLYTMMYIEIKCAQTKTNKIKANKEDIEKYAAELAYDNMGTGLNELELIIYADKKRTQTLLPGIDTNVAILRKILNYAYKIGYLHTKQPRTNIYISVPVNDGAKEVRMPKQQRKKTFVIPTVEECTEYFKSRNVLEPAKHAQEFYDHNDTRDWIVGQNKVKMASWKGAIRTWISKNYSGTIIIENKKGSSSSVYG